MRDRRADIKQQTTGKAGTGQIEDTIKDVMLKRSALLLIVLSAAGCSNDDSPTAPTVVTALPPITVPLPTTVPGVLALAMPIDQGDAATTAFGLAPFGYHSADHALDGHPGWDVEYRLGGVVRAAAAGTVQSVFPDPASPGRSTVHLEHVVGTHFYRTVYTNLATVSPEIVAAATVRAGQSLGAAGSVSQTVGTTPITYAMTHFQLDDFEYYREIPNPNAVTPEPFLTADAKLFFERIWSTAVFSAELVEPFASGPRDLRFPATRTWTRVSGNGPAGIRFTRTDARNPNYEYAILTESGTAVETGTVTLGLTTRPFPSIDLVSATGRRLGSYDIVSDQMRLSLANAGGSRPTDLGTASLYRTPR
jgi:hypothetical protein